MLRRAACALASAVALAARRPLVLEVGLPKTGTTSLAAYFRCSGWRASHQDCVNASSCAACTYAFVADFADEGRTGAAARTPRERERDFRRRCGDFDVFAQLDDATATACLFPQVDHLAALVAALPGACFVLNTRPLDAWVASVASYVESKSAFRGLSLVERLLRTCPIHPRDTTGLRAWARRHVDAARAALRTAACSLEVDLAAPAATTAAALARTFNGTRASCWTQHNAHAPRKRRPRRPPPKGRPPK